MRARTIWMTLLLSVIPLGVAEAGRFEKRVPAEPGGTLRVRLDAGSVEVEPDGDDEVRVDASYSGSIEFDLRSDGRDVELEGRREGLFGLFGGGRVDVRLRIPESYSVDVETGGGTIELEEVGGWVKVRTGGGSILVEGARGPVDLRTSGGSIRAYEVDGQLDAHTSGGGIRVGEVAGPVHVETSGGRIQVHDVGGPVRARTSGGSISVRFEASPEGELETSGGSIEAELPEGEGVDLEARTSGGRVEVDPPIVVQGARERDHVTGRVYGGGPTLSLRTSGGNIRVRVR